MRVVTETSYSIYRKERKNPVKDDHAWQCKEFLPMIPKVGYDAQRNG